MNIFLRNTISKFHDAVSTVLAAMSNYLAMRQKSDCDAAFLLYQITKAKLCYGHTLKDIIEKEATEEEAEDRRTYRRQSWLVPQEHERALKGAYTAL